MREKLAAAGATPMGGTPADFDAYMHRDSVKWAKAVNEVGVRLETETRYAITSPAPNASEIVRAVRLHWGIENGFHRCLDIAFREDASAIRLRNAAANFALLRRFALNLFRLDKSRVKSLPKKREAAA